MRGHLIGRRGGRSTAVTTDLARAFPHLARGRVEEIARRNAELRFRLESLKDVLPLVCEPTHHERWSLVGREYLDSALRGGNGVILLTAHLGYSKLTTPILRAFGYDATSVVAKSLRSIEREERITTWIAEGGPWRRLLSRWLSLNSYERDCIAAQLDVRPIFSALAANRIVLIAGDGLKAAEFVPLPLLERTYPFATGFMKIAAMTGATIVPAFALEGEGDHYVCLRFEKPLEIDLHGTLQGNLAVFSRLLEEQIRVAPHLWYRWGQRDMVEAASKRVDGVVHDRWNKGVKALARRTVNEK